MAIRLGSGTPTALRLGAVDVSKAYLGAIEIFSAAPVAAPAISAASEDGTTLTIGGTSFGAAGSITPLLWENFESGADGATIAASPAVGSWTTAVGPTPLGATTYTTAQSHSGTKSLQCTRTAGEWGNFAVTLPDATKFYQTFWFRFSVPDGIGQARLAEIWGDYRIGDYNPGVMIGSDNGAWGGRVALENSGASSVDSFSAPTESAWHHFEMILRQSSVDTANGSVTVRIDGQTVYQKTGIKTRELNQRWELAHFFSAMTGFLDDSSVTWIDEAYIKDSWARVEIGDAPTYAACTKKSVQPLATWTDTAITATLNPGEFDLGTGTAYVYVTNEAGATNANGYAIGASPAAALRAFTGVGYAGGRTSTVVSVPTGTVDGDMLVMMFVIGAVGAAPGAPTPPAGWTAFAGMPTVVEGSGSFFVTTYAYWRVASSEPASHTFTHASASTDAVMMAVSGGAAVAPTFTTASNQFGGTVSSVAAHTVGAGAWVGFMEHNWDLWGGATPPTDFTERQDLASSLIYAADRQMESAGSTGAVGHTIMGTGPWSAILVSVEPA